MPRSSVAGLTGLTTGLLPTRAVPFGYYGTLGLGLYSLGSYYPYGYGRYDPWFDYGGGYYQAPYAYGSSTDDGSIRLKIKPSDAQVFADGFYVGIVDEFDGVFQKLHLPAGMHHLEIRAPGYETLTVDVRIIAHDKITYTGELVRQ